MGVLLIILILFTVSAASAAAPWDDISDNSVIYLNNQTYEITSQITIDKENVTIYGGSEGDLTKTSTLDGKNTNRIMYITGKNVKIVGVNFINGYVLGNDANTGSGGAIYSTGSNTTIDNCNFIDNKAPGNSDSGTDGFAGAIYFSGANAQLLNSYFENNTARCGGAIRIASSYSIVDNCTFINNVAKAPVNYPSTPAVYGGSVYVSTSNVKIKNSIFENNKINDGSAYGGAIFYQKNNNNFEIDNCSFTNNTAKRGGALFFNQLNNILVKNSLFYNNNASDRGGAICLTESSNKNITILYSIFLNNTATNYGSAVELESYKNFTMNYCILEGNSKNVGILSYGNIDANSIYNYNLNYWGFNSTDNFNYTNITINHAGNPNIKNLDNWIVLKHTPDTFLNQHTNMTLSWVLNDGSELDENLPDYTLYLSNNLPNNLKENSVLISNNTGKFSYIIDTIGDDTVTIKSFTEKQLDSFNLEVYEIGKSKTSQIKPVSDNQIIYLNNTYYNWDGTINITNDNVIIYGGFKPASGDGWDGNTSTLDGFGHLIMNITGNNVKLVGIKFINGTSSDGGALYVKNNVVIENCEFINNTATSKGGAIFVANPVASQSDVNPDIYANPVTYSISLKNCLFENNTALQGGAVYTFIMKTDIVNCTFIGNNATQAMGTAGTRFTGAGGALYIDSNDRNSTLTVYKDDGYVNWGDKLTLTNSKFVDNYAPNAVGGAIHLFRPKEGCIDNNTFENNTAYRVGAVNIEGSQWFKVSTDILNSKFNYNKATYIIGAVYYLDSGNSIVKNCEFNNNNGSLQCGALQGYDVVNLTINNCTFNNNTCENDGGAIYLWRAAELNIFNSKFNDNKAICGGSIFIYEDSGIPIKYRDGIDTYCNISNTVFTNNKAVNGTLYFYYKPSTKTTLTVTIKNSTFINNTATDTASAIYDDNLKQLNVENSIFDNNTGDATIYLTKDNYTLDKNFFATNSSITSDEFIASKIISKNGEYIAPDEIIVLNITSSDYKYKLVFISNKTKSQVIMPYYEANVTFNGTNPTVVPVNTDQISPITGKVTFKASSIYSKNLLANLTLEISEPPASDVEMTVSVPSEVTGNNVTVTVTFNPNDATGTVFISMDGKSYPGTVKNGKCSITIKDLTLGKHTIDVFYTGNDKYNPIYKNVTINVKDNRAVVNMEVLTDKIAIGKSETVSIIILPKDATGTVSLTIDGKTFKGNVKNGQCSVAVSNLTSGTYDMKVSYSGDSKYQPLNQTAKLTVTDNRTKVNMTVLTPEIASGKDATVTISITPKDASGTITLTIAGKTYNGTVKNGNCVIAVGNTTLGKHNMQISYSGDSKYKPANQTANITVKKDTEMAVEYTPEVIYEGDKVTVTVKLPSNATGQVTFQIEGLTGWSTENITKGTVKHTFTNLKVGNVTIRVLYKGDNVYMSKSENISFEVKTKDVVLETSDLTKYFKGEERFTAEITQKGIGIANETVTFIINGIVYSRTTDKNGVASLAINLLPGTYTIQTLYKNINRENTIIVNSTIVGNDIVKYYRNGTQYVVYATDLKGNPLVNKTIIFNIVGTFYSRTTDDKGFATLNINLSPGEYIVTAYNPVNGEGSSNIIKVLPTIEGNDLYMKYHDGSKYECKLVDGQGKPVKGAILIYNIVGVFYSRTTDADGIARLNINLLPGDYIITASYNGTMTSNMIYVRA